MTTFEDRLTKMRAAISAHMRAILREDFSGAPQIADAMEHTLLADGKLLRPTLAVIVAESFGTPRETVLDAACAVEFVHAASLILDDLPAMDNAGLRRGRPANHLVFGEATSILAAIALLNHAYELVGRAEGLAPDRARAMLRCLTRSVGPEGLVGGQHQDLRACGRTADADLVEAMHDSKTSALFVAALELGALAADATEACRAALTAFGRELGLAFQTLDDFIDAYGACDQAGKDVGKDAGKANLLSLLGPKKATAEVRRRFDALTAALAPLGAHGADLQRFAQWLLDAQFEKYASCEEFRTLRDQVATA